MRFVSVLLYMLLELSISNSHQDVSIASEQSSQELETNANYATVVHQASPECWKTALKAFQLLRQDNQDKQSTSAAASTSSPSELSATLCSAMTSEHQDLLALEVTRCHMKGRMIFHSSPNDCSSTSSTALSLEGCIQQLTDTAFTTFTQFKIYIYQICSRVTAEMVLQRQHDMVHTLSELALHVQDRQQTLQSYWEHAWEKGQVLEEERHSRHQTWLAEQDAVNLRQRTMMTTMMGLAHRMDDRQGVMQQFWDNVWERTRQRQEQWEQQSTTWLEQQQSLQQNQIQNLERFRQEMNSVQGHHATLVEQHSQQMEFLVDRHKIDLEQTQQRQEELEQQRQAKWLVQQETAQQSQRQDLERHREELQAWQTDQARQIEQHAQQIQKLTERHYEELQEWQKQQALQAQKHEQELQAFANGIAASAKPLLATETFVRRLFTGLTWWTSLLYLMVVLNLVWLLTLPHRCRSFRGFLFAMAIAEVLLEVMLHRYDCSSLTTNASFNNNAWAWLLQSSCRRIIEHRGEVIGWLRRGTILMECVVYLIGFTWSFVGSTPRKRDSIMDVRFQQMEERHLELLQRLEQRSSLITELLLQPTEMLPPPASTHRTENGTNYHNLAPYDSFTAQRQRQSFQDGPVVVSPQNQSSPNQSRPCNDGSSILALPPKLDLLHQHDRKRASSNFYDDDEDDDDDDQQPTILDDTNERLANYRQDTRLETLDFAPGRGELQHNEWRQGPAVDTTHAPPPLSFWSTHDDDEVTTRGSKRPQQDATTTTTGDTDRVDSTCSPRPTKIARIA